MQPSTLPGRSYVSVGSERKSRLLFSWRARDFSIAPLTGQTPTFVRATAGGAVIDRNGVLRTPVHSQPRFEMVDLDGDGVRETAGLLLELQQTQICPNPQAPNSWTDVGTPTITTGQSDPWGGTAAIVIEDNDAVAGEGKLQIVTFTGDGVKAFLVALRAGTAATTNIIVHDVTAATNRHQLLVTWNGASTAPTVTTAAGSGSIFPVTGVVDKDGNLWWLIAFSADGIVAANTNRIQINGGGATTGTFYLAGANAWNATYPTSWVATAATVRNADSLKWSFDAPPQALTIYVKHINRGVFFSDGAVKRLLHIGASNVNSDPRLSLVGATNGAFQLVYDVGASQVSSITSALNAAFGAVIEVRAVLAVVGASWTVRAHASINGGVEESAVESAALGSVSAWAAPELWTTGGLTGDNTAAVFSDIRIAAGNLSMAQMREAF